jgi:hypothetical protein
MAVINQIPGILDVTLVRGDAIVLPIDIDPAHTTLMYPDFDLKDHEIHAQIFKETRAICDTNPAGDAVNGERVFDFRLDFVDLATGRFALSLQPYETTVFAARAPYRWHLRIRYPNHFVRTLVAGSLKAIDP